MNAKKNSQGGFSLIELLVVVAIIGVLAAAGMVGYTSYLNGVKVDTHKNNAKALAQALKTTAVARVGGLSGLPGLCDDKTDALGAVGTGVAKSRITCADALAEAGGFASTLLTPAVKGGAYVESGSGCTGNGGKLVVDTATVGNVLACSTDSTPVALETASFGTEW